MPTRTKVTPYLRIEKLFPFLRSSFRPNFIPILQKGHFFKNILPTVQNADRCKTFTWPYPCLLHSMHVTVACLLNIEVHQMDAFLGEFTDSSGIARGKIRTTYVAPLLHPRVINFSPRGNSHIGDTRRKIKSLRWPSGLPGPVQLSSGKEATLVDRTWETGEN